MIYLLMNQIQELSSSHYRDMLFVVNISNSEIAEQSFTSEVTCDIPSTCKLGSDGIDLESDKM